MKWTKQKYMKTKEKTVVVDGHKNYMHKKSFFDEIKIKNVAKKVLFFSKTQRVVFCRHKNFTSH